MKDRFGVVGFLVVSLALIASLPAGAAGTGYFAPNTFDCSGMLAARANGTQDLGTPMELWMGVGNQSAGMLVGHATFYTLAGQDYVRIDLTDSDGAPGPDMFPFVATAIHIHFAPTVTGIPHTNSGNPIPGKFAYNIQVTNPYQTVYNIPVDIEAVGAIHLAVERYGGIEGFNFWLPNNEVTLRIVDYPSADDPTYFRLKISGGGFISTYNSGYGAGVYEAWCVDVDHTINLNVDYPAYLYSSYETLPLWLTGPGKLEYPGNLDKVNYLVNNFVTGDLVQPVDALCQPVRSQEALTYSDIQRAIWHYVDNNQSTSGLLNWNQERVNAIICAVDASGEGFVPTCDHKVIFIVVPSGPPGSLTYQLVIGQPVIGEIAVQCTSASGTAWGDGKFGAQFPGAKQWGTYFKVEGACIPTP